MVANDQAGWVMMDEKTYLSIGEVLGLLLEEFPDVTISKIRFLESQGLIEPERTASGYRKFTHAEIERLRFILRQQRENYLPLKVIRTRLDGDTSEGMVRPYDATAPHGTLVESSANHPTAKLSQTRKTPPREVVTDDTSSLSRTELMNEVGVDDKVLAGVLAAGLISPKKVGSEELFTPADKEILEIAARFIELGIDARHLKTVRHTVEREADLYEQRILPYLRQRNPQSHQQAMKMLDEFVELGELLRTNLMARLFRQLSD
jgi:DNA-binding transcriptional MerR regulator